MLLAIISLQNYCLQGSKLTANATHHIFLFLGTKYCAKQEFDIKLRLEYNGTEFVFKKHAKLWNKVVAYNCSNLLGKQDCTMNFNYDSAEFFTEDDEEYANIGPAEIHTKTEQEETLVDPIPTEPTVEQTQETVEPEQIQTLEEPKLDAAPEVPTLYKEEIQTKSNKTLVISSVAGGTLLVCGILFASKKATKSKGKRVLYI
ncbi:Hypothetical_protein [Hexamita inflata]|uniref:Hypothetical_protein n=1 Tax=Hexamita inflata TaxID=28002 RepID=A0AA86RJ41_9EUKA|nr:Hypothetical protein HINF_LOCUS66545 [Hexamita inflata]